MHGTASVEFDPLLKKIQHLNELYRGFVHYHAKIHHIQTRMDEFWVKYSPGVFFSSQKHF